VEYGVPVEKLVDLHIKYAFASARSEELCMRPVFVHSFLATMKQEYQLMH
jgi:hypothetical protein